MSSLHDLYRDYGQSPWLDNLRREWILNGELSRWVERGVRGLTSNPSIFQKAMTSGDEYDEQFSRLLAEGMSVADAYWELVLTDISGALDALAPVHEESDGIDGFVSVEVDPKLARDTDSTLAAARALNQRVDRSNLYVKIPGTAEGLPAIQAMTAEGRSVNVTLLFSLSRYADVIEAYLCGLEECEGDLSTVSGVASFFISRTDTEVDRRLEAIGTPEALALRGQTAVAQGQVAYQIFNQKFSGPRWEALTTRGARVQRPLWASTSTKNPAYPDTLYVDQLIGPDTVNTLPDATLEAFLDHGELARTVDADPASAQAVLDRVTDVGVDLEAVANRLEDEGVSAFVKSFDDLIESLTATADRLMEGQIAESQGPAQMKGHQ
ncbi:MAG: transaldolase [Acidimicrobiia bacterium]|nr:transaldolase [Acidimicrobiia bacterium]MYB08561.1 transaldolase [Acidimicrobiia bacterium]MYB75453.1 transaldolase [Acidimicrobiia bacterium]MYG59233.1 transaldolase [Acidimicrobiia bacterium]MYH98823.1 transaldolase [Acidimicrobiia bacterium]